MKGLWQRLTERQRPAADPGPLPRPGPPVCVIGDLHGRLDLLEQMLADLAAHDTAAQTRLVFVGDMIDRGPDSAGVLRRLYDLQTAQPDRVTCLMGNHERMMLDFLGDPARHGPRWIAAGGAETLTSFGLSPYSRTSMEMLATKLRKALPSEHTRWLESLPLIWQDARLAVTHAGADPALPMAAQPPGRLLWGPQGREAPGRQDGIWIVQGHTIVEKANSADGRIFIDTGAWRTGRLSAVWIDKKDLYFRTIPAGIA